MAIILLKHEQEIFEICATLSEVENLKATAKESGKGAIMVGACAFVGGLVGGPIGLAVGGTFSSIAVACSSKDYKSVVYILRNELTNEQKQRLVNAISKIINRIGPQDFAALLPYIIGNADLKEKIIKELGMFLLKELCYKMS